MLRQAVAIAALIASAGGVFAGTAVVGGAIPVPLPLFPAGNWWNLDISAAPLDANSANFITFTGPATRVRADFDPTLSAGFPYIIVDGLQAKKTVTFDVPSESDGYGQAFYPIPDEAITTFGWIQSLEPGTTDLRDTQQRTMLIVDKTNNTLYELSSVWFNGTNWQALSGAFFDMTKNDHRPEGWLSADPSGLAVLPGLVRYDEVQGPNEIGHAFRVTVPKANGHVPPASRSYPAGLGATQGALPLGARLRLKATKVISSYPSDAQKVLRALNKYGLIVTEIGAQLFVSGSYDTQWSSTNVLTALASLSLNDFEVVQRGWPPPPLIMTLVGPVGAGDAFSGTITLHDTYDNIATGYRGTIHFASTDAMALLPANYTFTAADAGTHVFTDGFTLQTAGNQTITATDTNDATITGQKTVPVGPSRPTGLIATATTDTNVNVSWNASNGAVRYQIFRAAPSLFPYGLIATTTGAMATTYSDPVKPGEAYVYYVSAQDSSSNASPQSNRDTATTIFFTDDSLAASSTFIKAVHITELRQAVNSLRSAAALSAMSFTDLTLDGTVPVRAVHLQQLRTALAQARTALGLPPLTYTDPTINGGTSIVRAAHVQDLRESFK